MNTQEKPTLKQALQPILDKKRQEAIKTLGKSFQNIQTILKDLQEQNIPKQA
jgi:hypothetical protein